MRRSPLVWLLCVSLAMAQDAPPAGDDEAARRAIAAELSAALQSAEQLAEPAAAIAVLKEAYGRACAARPDNVLLPTYAPPAAPAPTVALWKSAVTEARNLLQFEPVEEAPLPEGFPVLTPVGEIRVLEYPSYRLARADMKERGDRSFWTLFMHIKRRDIAMTAPVEMTYDAEGRKQQSMAFLYRSLKQGKLENDDRVSVVDVPAMTVLSLGLRGNADEKSVAAARARLETWLKQHADRYQAAGPLRVMGHNSPFVASAKRYHEVQIPVRPAGNP